MTSPRIELWSLIGPFWRLPVRVVWVDDLAEVRVGAGANLTSRMRLAGEEMVGTVGVKKGSIHWVTRLNLEKVAEKFDGDDPEEIIEWMPKRAARPLPGKGFVPADFIQGYAYSPYSMVRDPLIADAIWVSMCKWMLHWLVNERKSVDLFFAELHSVPFRKNWQGAVAKREHELQAKKVMAKKDFLNPNMQNMIHRGVAAYMMSRSVTAYDEKTGTIRYSIECVTKKDWNEMVARVEGMRRSLCNGQYAKVVASLLRKDLPKTLKLYANYLEEAARPALNVFKSKPASVKGPIFINSQPIQASVPPAPWDQSVVLRNAVEQSGEEIVSGANESLRQVPDIQPGYEDLWDTGQEHLPQSGNRTA